MQDMQAGLGGRLGLAGWPKGLVKTFPVSGCAGNTAAHCNPPFCVLVFPVLGVEPRAFALSFVLDHLLLILRQGLHRLLSFQGWA